jgi:transcriptional regulator with XRE-family HTH domain
MCQVGKASYYCRKGNFLENKGIREILAANLKENRRKLGLTQEELAEKASVSTHYIAMIETCKKYPKPEMLEQIARTLEIQSYKLFSVVSDPNEPLERLHQKIVTDMKQIVSEAVEKIINSKCKKDIPDEPLQ